MSIQTRIVEYHDGDTLLEGWYAWDDAAIGQRPGVLVGHMWPVSTHVLGKQQSSSPSWDTPRERQRGKCNQVPHSKGKFGPQRFRIETTVFHVLSIVWPRAAGWR